MSLATVEEGGLLLRDQALEMTTEHFIGQIITFVDAETAGSVAPPTGGLAAEIQCSVCHARLELAQDCPEHPHDPVHLVFSEDFLKTKMNDVVDKYANVTTYERSVIALLFSCFIYQIRMTNPDPSPVEAAQALVLMEVIR